MNMNKHSLLIPSLRACFQFPAVLTEMHTASTIPATLGVVEQ